MRAVFIRPLFRLAATAELEETHEDEETDEDEDRRCLAGSSNWIVADGCSYGCWQRWLWLRIFSNHAAEIHAYPNSYTDANANAYPTDAGPNTDP